MNEIPRLGKTKHSVLQAHAYVFMAVWLWNGEIDKTCNLPRLGQAERKAVAPAYVFMLVWFLHSYILSYRHQDSGIDPGSSLRSSGMRDIACLIYFPFYRVSKIYQRSDPYNCFALARNDGFY